MLLLLLPFQLVVNFRSNSLKRLGKSIVYIVLLEASGALTLVLLAVTALGKPIYIGILLGGIASATAPAATVMVLKEYEV